MINNSRSPVAEMLSGKYKIWLIVGLALMLVADCIACSVLIVHGSSAYLFIPLVMAILDALYLAAVIFSNQRFKYARTLFIVYIVTTFIFCAVWIITALAQSVTEFTYTAVAVWSVMHVIGACAAVISYIYASKRIKGGRSIQFILAIAFSCVAVLGCGVYYSIEMFNNGYFGQGSDVRPLLYEYYADNTCAVVGVVNGNETSVVVPYEFNGRKVTEVSSIVLTSGIKNVTLECDMDAALFDDISDVADINDNINIFVDKSKVDQFKERLYSKLTDYAYALGNNVRPVGLGNDEVYITFDYDSDSYRHAHHEIIPTWYGKKGDVFNLSDVTDLEYVLRSDIRSDEDLYVNYYHNSGYIMSALKYKGTKIDGMKIGSSCFNVPVRFQNVYMVMAGESNDLLYDTNDYFDFAVVDGQKRNFKLTVAETADELLNVFDRGDGFDLEMQYLENGGERYKKFTSLSEVLKEHYNVTIAPHWSLVQPEIQIATSDDKTEVVYGDKFSLTAKLTHPLGNYISADYEWYSDGIRRGYNQTYNESKISYVGEHEYRVTVGVSAPSVTSLSTAVAANINITASKRPLTAVWTDPESNVFDDTNKYITVAFDNVAEGDSISPWETTYVEHNVCTETYTTSIRGPERDYYYIASGNTHTFTLLPCPVTLDWGGDEFSYEYNGTVRCPHATAVDLYGEPLTIGYGMADGSNIDGDKLVKVGSYTVQAYVISDPNYTPDPENGNDKRKVTVYPMQIDVTWKNTELTFNGQPQAPTASAKGAFDADVKVTVTGRQTKANLVGGEITTQYTATATTADGNYELSPETAQTSFVIRPFEVTVTWYDLTLTYNGQPQAPRPYAMGVNANLEVTLTGLETDVGDNYTVTAAIDSTDFVITSGESQVFSIVPYTLRVTWSNDVFTYDGLPHNPTVSATGVNGVNVPISVTSAPQTNADTYTATAGISGYNYTIAENNRTHTFKINKRNITVSWINTQLIYNGEPQAPTPKLLYAIGEPEFTINGKGTDASKNYYYTAWIQLNDNNHTVSQGASCLYTINAKQIAVDWGSTTLAYNGQNQVPTASITGVDGEVIELKVSTPWKDISVVGSYVAYAEFKTPNNNYELTGASQKSYTIVKKKINVIVRDATTWKGVQPVYDFDVDGIVGNEDVAVFCGISGSWNEVGEYDIIVTMIGSDCGNYELNIVRHGKLTVKAQED